jgi:hypothetical protein
MTAIGGGLDMFDLIGEATIALGDYTNTTTAEVTDTGINISNTDYVWGFVIVTCDTPVVGANDWGATFNSWGRYTINANMSNGISIMQRGTSTASFADLTSTSGQGAESYGIKVENNRSTVMISRKCHATACPLCRAGNYTVKVYGLKSL